MCRYLPVEMPDRFELQVQAEHGDWIGEAICLRRRFERLEDGSYICSEFSSGLWIRCIAHHDGYFEHVDGGGEGVVHRYRLVPLRCRTTSGKRPPHIPPRPREP